MEVLESRQLLATVQWISTTSGSWDVGSNWSADTVPGPGDDVVIDVSGASPTVTISSNVESVNSITAADPLVISGGGLTVAANSTISGGLSMTGGSLTASGSGVTLTVTGTTTVSGANLYAAGGATLSLPQVSSYTEPNALSSSTFEASGTGSVLSLPALTSIAETAGYTTTNVNALSGGDVQLPSVTELTGSVAVESENASSSIDLSSLPDINGGSLTVTGQGTVLAPDLTTLNGTSVTLDGTGTLAISQWTTLTSSSLTITAGSYTFPGLTDIDGSSLYAQANASLTLPAVTSYTEPNAFSSSTFEASGTGSVLSLPALTSIAETAGYTTTNVNALSGGDVQLPSVTELTGSVAVESENASSSIDLSSLPDINGGSLTVTGQGTVLAPDLTTLNGTSVTLDGTGTLAISQWTTLTSSSLTITAGSYTFPGLTDIDGSSLYAQANASLTLPAVTSYTEPNAFSSSTFEASGTGSVLSLPALSSIAETGGYTTTNVNALSGGDVQLPSVTELTESVAVESENASSSIDLSSLPDINGGSLTVTGQGTVLAPDLTTLNGTSVTLDGTGTLAISQWTTLTSSSLTITAGSYTFPGLTDITLTSLQLSGGATLSLPAFAQGNLPLSNGQSVTIQGTLVSMPAAGTSGATINVPQSQGLILTLQNRGTLMGMTFDVGQGTTVDLTGGTYSGGTTFNVGQGAAVDLTGGTYTGGVVFNVAQGATVDLTGGQTVTYSGTLTGSGAGTVQFSSGTLTVGVGGLTLNFAGNLFQWTGGGLEASGGNVTNLGNINLSGSNETQIYADGALDDYGTIIQNGTGDFGLHSDNVSPSTLMIEPGGLYEIESNAGVNSLSNSNVIDNAGTIEKTAGSGTSTLAVDGPLINTGTIEAESGTLSLDPSSFSQVSGNTLTGGTWNALDGSTLAFPSSTAITSNQGKLTLSGTGATIIGIAGLASNSGTFVVTNGADFTTAGGFTNSGSLTAGAGSIFTVSGNFTQTSAGSLNDQIGGTPASGLFGQVAATGTATLAGAFNLALVNGFSPSSGQTFDLMSFASATGDFISFNGLSLFFTESLSSTGLDIEDAATEAVDLAATSVTAPTTAEVGQSITVNWQATDQSSQATTGSWQDSVYISATPTITSSSTLLGMVPENITLDGGASYNASLTATLPAALAPGYYYVLVQVDSLYQLADPNRANNTLAATTGQIDIGLPALTLGTPYADSFTAADQDHYYQVTVPAGGSLNVSLQSSASSGAVAIYISQGTLPTLYNYQQAAVTTNQPNQTAVVPQVLTSGTYYILAHSVSGAAATAAYTLTVTQSSAPTVSAFSPASGGNAGNVTVEIGGTNFAPTATASLTLGGTTFNATAVDFVSASQMYATFDLAGATAGSYTLSVRQGSQSLTAPTSFQVVAATPESLNVVLTVPEFVRSGRTGTVVITYTNETDNDIVAPLLTISSTNTSVFFSTPDDPNDYVQSAEVLAAAPSGPAGILRPGQSGQLDLTLLSDDTINNDAIPVQVVQIKPGQPIDWASQQSSLQPTSFTTAAWNVIWNNLMATVGTTTDSYNAALAQAATYLSGLGETTAQVSDVSNLWSFLTAQANASFPTATLTSAVDAALPTPGSLSLAIDRTFVSSIAGRYQQGIFGMGWVTGWQTSLSTDSSGNVTINSGGSLTYFVKQANGGFLDTDAEYGTLTSSGGSFTFTDSAGTQYVFLANGRLSYEQDTNGNRISLGYNTQNQLVSLTYSNPSDSSEPTEKLTLTYNSQGFVSQVADGTGDTWDYTYDSAGHLLSAAGPGGLTTSYTYDTGTNPETANALVSITNPDGSRQNFAYDSQGRLSGTSQNGGADPVTYTYDGEAEVTATDAAGDKTTVWYNSLGLAARVADPLGGLSNYSYDTNGNLVSYTDAAGDTYQYTYDGNGNLTKTVNPLGQTVQMTYGPLDTLTSITDADNNTTQYNYSSAGNLLSIAYPDGTQQSFTYDPLGNLSETTLQNGDPVSYQYNAQGLVTQENFADGTYETFGYDAHGNMLTAQTYNASSTLIGTTTLTYNAANELTAISYPGGLSLTFTYNAQGQRTQSVDQSGYTINYSYDTLGRLAELTDGSGNLIVQYTYNNLGQLQEKLNGNGTYTTYAYDAAGDLTGEVNYANATTVNSSFTYTYGSDPQKRSGGSTLRVFLP